MRLYNRSSTLKVSFEPHEPTQTDSHLALTTSNKLSNRGISSSTLVFAASIDWAAFRSFNIILR